MNKREPVMIWPMANGYVVDVASRGNETILSDSALVFESMERLTAWVAVHFSKAEPVKAPECEHVWTKSILGHLYCVKCESRRAE